MINSSSKANSGMINLYNSRLNAVNIDNIVEDIRGQLRQWHENSHRTIDEHFAKKLHEIDSYVQKRKSEFENVKTKIEELQTRINDQQEANEGDINIIKLINHSIEQDLNDIEQTFIKINTLPLNIDDNCIFIENRFDLQQISSSPFKIPYTDDSSAAIASNGQYLLFHQSPNLCSVDKHSKIVKQLFWNQGWIRDMCWSETLHRFIMITQSHIFTIDDELQVSLIEMSQAQNWFSSTCSDNSLYLSTCEWGAEIYELKLLSLPDQIAHWKPPLTCKSTEGINDIKYNNETLAVMIKDPLVQTRRMELKSTKTFATLWSLQLTVGNDLRLFTCCSINHNEWLYVDGQTSYIYHISNDGKFKHTFHSPSVPYRANTFGFNRLVISSELDLNLYQLSS